MKNISVTLFAVAALTFSASAQQPGMMKKHGHMKHGHGKMMAKQLNFSEEQKKQAKINREDFRNKMQELNKNENITVKEMRDRRATLLKEQKTKMDALLTPEQKTKMEQMRATQKVKRNEHFAKHLDKMKTQLSLSDQQVAELKTQRENMQSKLMAIKQNQSLSREQKRDQLLALKTEAKEQHKKIFTADQMKKMEEMRKKRFDKKPAAK